MGLLEGFPEIANLDDKNFDELVNEARSLLARYGSEWTDHNIHDPGITFLELFAWLAEMQIYQLNRVSDSNYLKFLKLMGFSQLDAGPACLDITFDATGETTIAAGTQVSTSADSGKIVFETTEELNFIKARLKSILTTADSKTVDNTRANEKEDIYYSAFGETAPVGAVLRLGFDKPLPKKEIKLTVVLSEDDLPPTGSHADEPAIVIPEVSVAWEYLEGGKWNPLVIKKDLTLALTVSGRVVFDGPPGMDKKDGMYWVRCRLKEGSYEIAPRINMIVLNTIQAMQVETITDEEPGTGAPGMVVELSRKPLVRNAAFREDDVLDWPGLLKQLRDEYSSGKPCPGKRIMEMLGDNVITLINEWEGEPGEDLKYEVIAGLNTMIRRKDLYESGSFKNIGLAGLTKKSLAVRFAFIQDFEPVNRFLIEASYPGKIAINRLGVRVQEKNSGWDDWYEVDDFEFSGPDDTHYVSDPEKQEITFGNGLNGRCPSRSAKIRVSYKTTLEDKGNLSKGQKWVTGDGITGTNLRASSGGKAAETPEHAKARAKRDCRNIYRAITSQDYEQLALSTPGLRIARAKALSNYNPEFPCIAFPGTITIVIVPYTRQGVTPIPGEGFCETVLHHLDMHRLVTSGVYVVGPQYVKVSVKCSVHIKKGSSPVEVGKRVRNALMTFLDPQRGGADGKGWPFGRPVYPSEIYQRIEKEDGVDYALGVSLDADGKFRKGDAIVISPSGLVYSGEHQVEII
ncbi:Baseplate J-like protein [uncultured archaeon]|nr:Baseplate J-like protein [uncultured archaeon]